MRYAGDPALVGRTVVLNGESHEVVGITPTGFQFLFKHGFTRVRCPQCREEFFVPYSCRGRCFCPSCHQKRALEKASWVAEQVCAEVPHRQFVLTIPKRLRIYFRFDRRLLGELCRAAARTVITVYRAASGRSA